MKKQYHVKVYEIPYIYNIEAKTKEEAQGFVMNTHWQGDYECISKVEVIKGTHEEGADD